MMRLLIVGRSIRVGVLCAASSLSACTGDDSGLPPITYLSPENADHSLVQWAPDGSRVAYWESTSDGWNLMLANTDLSQARVLASSPRGIGTWPISWSSDGTSFAYAIAGDVWILQLPDGEPQRVTEEAGWEFPHSWHPSGDRLSYINLLEGGDIQQRILKPDDGTSVPFPRPPGGNLWFGAWSPDGNRIAYGTQDSELRAIWLADSSGGNTRQLTTEGFELLPYKPWSPDGTDLLYVSSRTGAEDVYVYPIGGDPPRQLTRDIRADRDPTWSPDGRWVAFISERGRQTDVWIVTATGGTELRVTDDEAEEYDLQWVPASTQLAFTTRTRARGLWTVSLADGSERRLTPDSIELGAYDLSYDRSLVGFQVRRGGGVTDLAVMPVSGGAVRTLVANGSENSFPRWSPDGSAVAFISNRSGNDDVWVVNAMGGEPTQLTDWPSMEWGLAWAADGSGVYFGSEHDASPVADLWFVPAAGGEPRRLTTSGTLQQVVASAVTSDVLISTLGGAEGRFTLSRVSPDATLEVLWDRTNVINIWRHGFMPSGDSCIVAAERPDGSRGGLLVPLGGGEGRWILDGLDTGSDWSADPTRLLGRSAGDVAVFSLNDGLKRLLTETAELEESPRWIADEQSVVFLRTSTLRRIVTADVGRLMEGGN